MTSLQPSLDEMHYSTCEQYRSTSEEKMRGVKAMLSTPRPVC